LSQTDNNKVLAISVVIPAYNTAKYISRAIDSVLAQTRPADEIIVVDDGSTDNTEEIVKKYSEKVNYICQENAGASVARNTGIKAANSKWIAFLDGDDEWLGEHLKMQTELLSRNPGLVWTTGNYYRCLCGENRRAPHLEVKKAGKLLAGKDYFDSYFNALGKDAGGWTGTMIIKKEALEKAGLFRPGQLKSNDIDMWLRIAYRWPKFGYVSVPLAVYHLNIPGSISRKYNKPERYNICEFVHRHLEMSREHNCYDAFRPYAVLKLRLYIRGILFDAQGQEVKRVLREFSKLFSVRYKAALWLLATFPRLTQKGCLAISWVVRRLHLRRLVVRRPQK